MHENNILQEQKMYEELNAHACIMQMEKYTHLYNYHLL